MMLRFRGWLLGMVACAAAVACGAVVPAAQAAVPFGVEKLVAANCKAGYETCVEQAIGPYSVPKEPTLAEAKAGGYTQAAGHPAFGVTAFQVNIEGAIPEATPAGITTVGPVTHVRTDVAPGVSTSPEAIKKCTMTEFEGHEVAPGVFTKPECSTETEIGVNKVIVYLGPSIKPKDAPLEGKVYNVVQPNGLSSLFAVALDLTNVGHSGVFAHTLIEGHVEWGTNYHDYYEIKVSPAIPLIASRLSLIGDKGNTSNGGFITNPSNCAGPGPFTTNTVTLESQAGQKGAREYTTPIGVEGCLGGGEFKIPPFEPGFKLSTETLQSDQPTGVTAETTLAHDPSPTALDNSQLKTATIKLPEGMTLSPSAAKELAACSLAQFNIATRNAVGCPAGSQIGTATLTVPQLPSNEPLQGALYLGGGPTVTGPPYEMYVDAESARYGVSVRLRGIVKPDPVTGQLTTEFTDNPEQPVHTPHLPEQPFTNLTLKFNGGPTAPLANPLACGPATMTASFVPYTGTPTVSLVSAFTVGSEKGGGTCLAPLPFSLAQSTENVPTGGGQASNFTLHLQRSDGQQYLSSVSAALPPGLLGKIPVVPLCPEPAASTGACPAASQIGKVATVVGSGAAAVSFTGNVYLTGPTGKAPYGMTMVVNAAIGSFSLGNVIARAGIEVDPRTARVTVAGNVPTIFAGIPLRLKTLTVAINRQGFLANPTNCGALATNTTLGSTLGATQAIATGFQATNCSALAFKPKFGATSNAKTSRANGAALVTHINYPSGTQANIRSVLVRVPKQLPSRLTTLKNACLAAIFKANPSSCPAKSRVGTARIKTPVLPGQLIGPAYFVSHGGAAFPDLDLVLSGDGVTVILEGNTNIKNGFTTTNFPAAPDAPFTGFELNLPSGPNSAVAAVGNLCKQSLIMPTTITAQNGKVIKQNTVVMVQNCPVTVLASHAKGNHAVVTVKAPAAGRVSGGGSHLKTIYMHIGKAQKVTLEVPLTSGRRPLTVRVRIGFVPKSKKEKASVAYATVRFR